MTASRSMEIAINTLISFSYPCNSFITPDYCQEIAFFILSLASRRRPGVGGGSVKYGIWSLTAVSRFPRFPFLFTSLTPPQDFTARAPFLGPRLTSRRRSGSGLRFSAGSAIAAQTNNHPVCDAEVGPPVYAPRDSLLRLNGIRRSENAANFDKARLLFNLEGQVSDVRNLFPEPTDRFGPGSE